MCVQSHFSTASDVLHVTAIPMTATATATANELAPEFRQPLDAAPLPPPPDSLLGPPPHLEGKPPPPDRPLADTQWAGANRSGMTVEDARASAIRYNQSLRLAHGLKGDQPVGAHRVSRKNCLLLSNWAKGNWGSSAPFQVTIGGEKFSGFAQYGHVNAQYKKALQLGNTLMIDTPAKRRLCLKSLPGFAGIVADALEIIEAECAARCASPPNPSPQPYPSWGTPNPNPHAGTPAWRRCRSTNFTRPMPSASALSPTAARRSRCTTTGSRATSPSSSRSPRMLQVSPIQPLPAHPIYF